MAAASAMMVIILLFCARADFASSNLSLAQRFLRIWLDRGVRICNTVLACTDGGLEEKSFEEALWSRVWEGIPIAKAVDGGISDEMLADDERQQGGISLEEAVIAENEAASEGLTAVNEGEVPLSEDDYSDSEAQNVFVPVSEPQALYSEAQLSSDGFIQETFYSVDPTTSVRAGQLDYDTLMGFDATLKSSSDEPQILVYHTHSQETYIDSVPGDDSTSIMGVGEYLCEILREEYGYNVIHHLGKYDVESRDYAYSNAMEDIEKVLAENPSIEVIIDLHRDETSADTRLVTTIQGMEMARFMFFNGLCYTNELGELDSLPNPYLQDNLSFAFQMQLFAEEYYPGLTRRIYLKGYRYNMHYRSKTLLIELGSQTNTVQEAMNSCEPLAHIISEVLSGENKQ